ncbi:MAG: acyl-CoA/acyl-ACP dehydrogenase [Actinomycetia bacterium]|nr:acyl-CoA/acyl-ACP dehydrogenase [Actinomycetes bacterium]
MDANWGLRSIEAATEQGRRAVDLAVEVGADFIDQAGEWDRAAAFPTVHIERLQASGLTAATCSVDSGGGGVSRVLDQMAIVNRLARADSSVGIASNMHLSFLRSASRLVARGVAPAGLIDLIGRTVAGETWVTAAVSEAGTNYFHPRARLRVDGSGWVLNGEKIFATGSPAATDLTANVVVGGGDLDGRLATIVLPVDHPGIEVVDDWDGMGMRGSGSGRVLFHDAALGADTVVLPGGPAGSFSPDALVARAVGNVGNLAAIHGVAENARRLVVERVTGEQRVSDRALSERPTVRQSLGQLETDLLTAVAVLRDIGGRADEMVVAGAVDMISAQRFMAEFQAAKLVANAKAIAVVDRGLELAGGAGYTGSHPLSRLYRDVRAGPFMQPFTPHEGLGWTGAVVSGRQPDIEA